MGSRKGARSGEVSAPNPPRPRYRPYSTTPVNSATIYSISWLEHMPKLHICCWKDYLRTFTEKNCSSTPVVTAAVDAMNKNKCKLIKYKY